MATNETIMNVEDIMKTLPHRYPFLLVDRVIEKNGTDSLVAIKNLTMNEEFFKDIFLENLLCQGYYKWKRLHKQLDYLC